MTDTDRDGLILDDPDRLPWLETADGYEYGEGTSPAKIILLVFAGMVLFAAIVGGIYWTQRGDAVQGTGELIAAPKGDYKAKPQDSGGKTFEGEGDAAFAASDGQKTSATIATAPSAVATNTAESAAKPENTQAPAGSTFVQLGAFSEARKGIEAWATFQRRFDFLSGVNHRIVEVEVDGGRTVFRLQAISPNKAAADQLCSKLKSAGEACIIIR